jgi:hypothetical protein
VEAISLLDIFGVIERLEELSDLGHTVLEILAPSKVDEQEVHVGRPERIRRAEGIPDRHELDLVAAGAEHWIDLRPQALGAWRRAHVVDE